MLCLPWRFRVLTRLGVPGTGWAVADLGWVEGAQAPAWDGDAATADGVREVQNRRVEITYGPGAGQ